MDPRTDINVIHYKGNFALVNPQGALHKINKYTVMYIVQLNANDLPIMLIYRKDRKTVCSTSLASPQHGGPNDVLDFVDVLTYAMKSMQ